MEQERELASEPIAYEVPAPERLWGRPADFPCVARLVALQAAELSEQMVREGGAVRQQELGCGVQSGSVVA